MQELEKKKIKRYSEIEYRQKFELLIFLKFSIKYDFFLDFFLSTEK